MGMTISGYRTAGFGNTVQYSLSGGGGTFSFPASSFQTAGTATLVVNGPTGSVLFDYQGTLSVSLPVTRVTTTTIVRPPVHRRNNNNNHRWHKNDNDDE